MATPVPPNVVHIPLTVEAAVVATAEGESPPLVAAMEGGEGGNAFHAHICVCDINAAPSKTLQVRIRLAKPVVLQCGVTGRHRMWNYFTRSTFTSFNRRCCT